MKEESHTTSSSEAVTSHSVTDGKLRTPVEQLTAFLEETLARIGYDLVAIEVLNHREKSLRVFIDTPEGSGKAMGIEDCVIATRELDEPLEGNSAVSDVFKGPYELEVSSPGVDRPLRKPRDYTRFAGEYGRIHTFRPLTKEETGAEEYSLKNPKQKNFYGIIRGYDHESNSGSVLFGNVPEDGTRTTVVKGAKKSNKKKPEVKPETLIRIPLELISKANLEPEIVFPEEDK